MVAAMSRCCQYLGTVATSALCRCRPLRIVDGIAARGFLSHLTISFATL